MTSDSRIQSSVYKSSISPHSQIYIYSPPQACPIKQKLRRTEQRRGRRWLRSSPHLFTRPLLPHSTPITMTERRPAAPGLCHLLPHGFFCDSVRKLCRYLLLSLLHWPRWARIRGPLPVHLLNMHRPTPRKSGRYTLQKLQIPKCCVP